VQQGIIIIIIIVFWFILGLLVFRYSVLPLILIL